MSTGNDPLGVRRSFSYAGGKTGDYYSLPALQEAGLGKIDRLPVSIRVVLESVLRHAGGPLADVDDVRALAGWQGIAERTDEIPFVVARIVLQDFTGVPLLVDLAAMRAAVERLGKNAGLIEPLVPVDLVVDHSIQVDFAETKDALQRNMEIEFKRNNARYQFLKWGMQAFNGFSVVPPGVGIVHQVNLEYLAQGVLEKEGVWYPDSLVGTDSHTTMINGLGVVAWGVGGIEAEAGMLGQPVYFLTPDVVGVHLKGSLKTGVTATDLVLRITEMLRATKVVGKFVEYYGEGAASLSLTDRATIANMAPEYGATMGFFPTDEETCRYFTATGRTDEQVDAIRQYYKAQSLFGMPVDGQIDYSQTLELDLSTVQPSVAGPKRPQDRIDLASVKERFNELLLKPLAASGYGKTESDVAKRFFIPLGVAASQSGDAPLSGGGEQDHATLPASAGGDVSVKNTSNESEVEMVQNRPTPDRVHDIPAEEFPSSITDLHNGDVVIAAITSCTNTSNPSVMLAAGLLAKKAVEKGLSIRPAVKTSLAPGSRVVTEYLTKSGLQSYLDDLGFQTVGYGCTTCIGNSGPLEPHLEEAIVRNDLVVASVLSGNRNFEARVHQNVKANFLMSPPLVVAFALAGRVDIDLTTEPLGTSSTGEPVYLRDIWPTYQEIDALLHNANDPESYRRIYQGFNDQNPLWQDIPASEGRVYDWDLSSTYIQEPPYFEKFSLEPAATKNVQGARALAIFGDSVTTDHISPAGAIKPSSPAGLYLQEKGVPVEDFNSYGSRRGNDRIMVRGTFANVRIKNLMTPGIEGGVTVHQPSGEQMSIYDASLRYQAANIPLVIFSGEEYGTGSSRDWAAKGTALLGVRAVVAKSFERIHRSNLVMMGVLPLQFQPGSDAASIGITGGETFDLEGLDTITPRQEVTLVIHGAQGDVRVPVTLRIDTPVEVEYYQHGGILPFVLRQLVSAS
jgi:aconitate hydratase